MTHVDRASWRGGSLSHACRIRCPADSAPPPSSPFATRGADSLYWCEVNDVVRQMSGLAAVALGFLAALLIAPMPSGLRPCPCIGLGNTGLSSPVVRGDHQRPG